jgi:putative ABC transport system permease protein
MAAVVTLLAVASMVHALVLAVGRHRRVLGVLKGLGFTRAQIGATVACHATAYALVAVVVAVPLGAAIGRWGWRLIAETLGVPPVPVVPLGVPALGAVAFLVITNLAAAYPAWRAARLSTAAALRAE